MDATKTPQELVAEGAARRAASDAKAAKVAPKAKATPKPKAAKKKLSSTGCRYGQGSYGSPATMKRCDAPRLPKKGGQMCAKHEPMAQAFMKKRADAKRDAAPATPVVAKATTRHTAKGGALRVVPAPTPAHAAPVARVPKHERIAALVTLAPTDEPN